MYVSIGFFISVMMDFFWRVGWDYKQGVADTLDDMKGRALAREGRELR